VAHEPRETDCTCGRHVFPGGVVRGRVRSHDCPVHGDRRAVIDPSGDGEPTRFELLRIEHAARVVVEAWGAAPTGEHGYPITGHPTLDVALDALAAALVKVRS
jgi:hypothetical protein